MESWLAHIPAWLVLVLFALVPAVVAVALHALFRRYVPAEDLIPHNDVAGFLVGIAGVLYAVVLGFVVVTVWVSFDAAQTNADLEASDVAEIFSFAGVLPEPARTELRAALANYAFEVRDREWPMLVYGRQDLRARSFYRSALPVIASIANAKRGGDAGTLTALQQNALTVVHELSVHRRARLIGAESGLPEAIYVALIAGAAIVVAFTYLFGVDHRALQFTMTFLIVAMIGLLFGTIVSLDHPYSGPIRVSSQAWTLVIENNDLAKYRTAAR
jgi:membrane protein implicated in regulation of membrane protease activity